MFNKKRNKLKLGKSTKDGYEYSARIDFTKNLDLSEQIANFIKEKKVVDELNLEIKKLKEYIKKFSSAKKEKNLTYYFLVGKKLSFIEKDNFREVAPYSIFRRIKEEIPDILPHLNPKLAQKHLEIMYNLGQINKRYINLKKIEWHQWYEIGKFKKLCQNKKLLKVILDICQQSKNTGPSLREKIRSLLRSS